METQKLGPHFKEQEDLRSKTCRYLGFKPNTTSTYEQDIIEINLFLQNKERVLEQLKALDLTLRLRIERERTDGQPITIPDSSNAITFLETYKKPYTSGKHSNGMPFLYTFFEDWAQNNGILLTRFQTPSGALFTQTLASGTLFKDLYFAGEFHGSWTHLIQWYCIVEANRDGKLSLKNTPVEILKWLGKTADPKNKIWHDTFESNDPRIPSLYDFRGVLLFNRYLHRDAELQKTCPILGSLIKYRTLKAQKRIDENRCTMQR